MLVIRSYAAPSFAARLASVALAAATLEALAL